MQPLRLVAVWRVVGWLLVGAIVYLSLTPQPLAIDFNNGDKLGHACAYLVVMLWFAQLYERARQPRWGAAFIALGVALEYVQGWTGYRDFEYADMAADAAGVLLGWLLAATALSRLLQGLERFIFAP